jgi:hypothetical protein
MGANPSPKLGTIGVRASIYFLVAIVMAILAVIGTYGSVTDDLQTIIVLLGSEVVVLGFLVVGGFCELMIWIIRTDKIG